MYFPILSFSVCPKMGDQSPTFSLIKAVYHSLYPSNKCTISYFNHSIYTTTDTYNKGIIKRNIKADTASRVAIRDYIYWV